MTSKQIAVKYIGQTFREPESIFKNVEILKTILPWARDSAREYFTTQPAKFFLVDYIDDVAPIVDEYMITRAEEMYKKAIKSQNKLFENLCSPQKTIGWVIDRWINTFINLTSNRNYKKHIEITKIKKDIYEGIEYLNFESIENDLEFEKVKKLPTKDKIKLLKEVWEEARYDDFDELDMLYLVEKLDLRIDEVFENKGDLEKLNLRKIQVENGNSQLVLLF